MKIELHEITVRDLIAGYVDNLDEGVVGYGGRLDIRPPYQREFVYKDAQRDAVIDTVYNNFPLNVMYWAVRRNGSDRYEMIDGQQRTLSICQFAAGKFSVKGVFAPESLGFYNLQNDQKEKILNYELKIYFCDGTASEKLKWFRTINIAGEKLTDQELRNAIYHGSWVSAAKRWFSKRGCPAYRIGSEYMGGSAIRQEYLETAIKWHSGGDIEGYMSKHQNDADAKDLWNYFDTVIAWVQAVFTNYRREMKGLPWGAYYNAHKDRTFDASELEKQTVELMQDDEVKNKKGIYAYLLTGKEKHLNLRQFTDSQKRSVYEQQGGICKECNERFDIGDMDADHTTPWSKGGKTEPANCQLLCRDCNRHKSNK